MHPNGTLFRQILPNKPIPGSPDYLQTGLYGVLKLRAGLITDAHYPITICSSAEATTLVIYQARLHSIGEEHRYSLLSEVASSQQWRITTGPKQHSTMVLRKSSIPSDSASKAYYLAVAVIGTPAADANPFDGLLDFKEGVAGPVSEVPFDIKGASPDQVLLGPSMKIHSDRVSLMSTLQADAHAEVDLLHEALNTPEDFRTEMHRQAIQSADADRQSLPGQILRHRVLDPSYNRFCLDYGRRRAA